MAVDTTLTLERVSIQTVSLDVQALASPGLFAACLATQMDEPASSDTLEDRVKTLKEAGFTGFFKRLEEEKLKELREEILREMGLTEEDLGNMEPERRAAVEKIIAQEIRRRMLAEAAEEDGKKTDTIKKRMLMAELGGGMELFDTGSGKPEEPDAIGFMED